MRPVPTREHTVDVADKPEAHLMFSAMTLICVAGLHVLVHSHSISLAQSGHQTYLLVFSSLTLSMVGIVSLLLCIPGLLFRLHKYYYYYYQYNRMGYLKRPKGTLLLLVQLLVQLYNRCAVLQVSERATIPLPSDAACLLPPPTPS